MSEKVWIDGYLAALAETGHHERAYSAIGKDRTTVWKERKANPEFAKAESDALKAAGPVLRDEAVRRAVYGLRRYKFTKGGEPILDPRTGEQYYEIEYSDTLLTLLLKATIPEFKDKLDVKHEGESTVVHLTRDEWKKRMEEARA